MSTEPATRPVGCDLGASSMTRHRLQSRPVCLHKTCNVQKKRGQEQAAVRTYLATVSIYFIYLGDLMMANRKFWTLVLLASIISTGTSWG